MMNESDCFRFKFQLQMKGNCSGAVQHRIIDFFQLKMKGNWCEFIFISIAIENKNKSVCCTSRGIQTIMKRLYTLKSLYIVQPEEEVIEALKELDIRVIKTNGS